MEQRGHNLVPSTFSQWVALGHPVSCLMHSAEVFYTLRVEGGR